VKTGYDGTRPAEHAVTRAGELARGFDAKVALSVSRHRSR
jgi:hypothetical protein